jgi:hypothetical protein
MDPFRMDELYSDRAQAVLAADCAAGGTYEFQLVAPPLRVTGAWGPR